ncbi:MAG TPA: formate dehydrogenase subunit alpha [Methanotrichaceae archaeon]|nr:formate dehydrogenase subunit alpha [Methanotrichaceae archaeon]
MSVSDESDRSMVATICPYCACGCGFYLEVERGQARRIIPRSDHPVNQGALCPKGWASLEMIHHPERLKWPLRRTADGWERLSWQQALQILADNLRRIGDTRGPDALGFLSSTKCTNEENYLIQKLARTMGCANVDSCARLCHASTVVGLRRSMGSCSVTNPLSDLANSRCILVIGSNFAENHPILARWVLQAKEAGATLIVADPRRTPTAWLADQHLPLRPGTDVALLNGMVRHILDQGLHDRDFVQRRTTGLEQLRSSLADFSLARAERITGVSAGELARAARAYASSPASAVVYGMGVTQHASGTAGVEAVANLALLCGQLGRPGTGILPMRGQNNVQGACDMGAMTEFYPGYRLPEDPRTVQVFGAAWGSTCLPARKGLTSMEMMDAALFGTLKAMYIVGEDPICSHPDQSRTRQALQSLDFLAVQDIFMTETAEMADLVLPAACWAEKEGTFTSAERRVQRIYRATDPPGEAREDLWIVSNLARTLGLNFPYTDASSVFQEICRRVTIYKGLVDLGDFGGFWPCLEPGKWNEILHQDCFPTEGGLARFLPATYCPSTQEPGADYPLLLTTGRKVCHFNSGSITRRTPSLLAISDHLVVEMNPEDAAVLEIVEGDRVWVKTVQGSASGYAHVSGSIPAGVVFMPFHFPATNRLTGDARDPISHIPELKAWACQVKKEV